jgi:hypothetical protein
MLLLSEAPKLLSVMTPDTPKVLESVVAGDALGRTVVEVVRASDYH